MDFAAHSGFELAYGGHNTSHRVDEEACAKFKTDIGNGFAHLQRPARQPAPVRHHCGQIGMPVVHHYPGGIADGFAPMLGKRAYAFATAAAGPASVGVVATEVAEEQSVAAGAGFAQVAVAALLHAVPPMIPPPVWNNQPLPCVPLATGHNCFGAVLYPITAADFALASVTDSMLDGVIAGFPTTFATKVGKTSETVYESCFAAYMSMHCSAIFPMCSAPQAREEPIPGIGRVPLCLHLCVIPLVMCPGFWLGDLIGSCTMVSAPPMCTQAFFWNLGKLPPQYADNNDVNDNSACPGALANDETSDSELPDAPMVAASPILLESASVGGAPPTREAKEGML